MLCDAGFALHKHNASSVSILDWSREIAYYWTCHSNEHWIELVVEMLRAVQPTGGKWKILLVDGKGLRILNSTCKTMEILEENVTGILH